MRSGTVALIGRTNVGKSTFLNAALGEPLAIVSPKPQTTRDALLGVVHRPNAQLAFLDTPGLHRPKTELGRRMNAAAREAARAADVLLLVTDVARLERARPAKPAPGAARSPTSLIDPEDLALLETLPSDKPLVVALNKVDLVRDKRRLLPLLEQLAAVRPGVALVPVSFLEPASVERVLGVLSEWLPEAPAAFDEDTLTDRPTSFFVREYIREQVLLGAQREVPHAVAVSLDRFEQGASLTRISATLHVEKVGQRKILVGTGGERIKHIGTAARARIEALLGHQVHLELFVRVTPEWRELPRQLAELGYSDADPSRAPAALEASLAPPEREPG